MRFILLIAFIGGALFIEAPVEAKKLKSIIPRRHHEWGSFELGSSKKVRVETENFENGILVSTNSSETTTTLLDVDEYSATLRIEVALEINGRHYPSEPKTDKLDYSVGLRGKNGEISVIGKKPVVIDGETFQTEVRQIKYTINSQNWISEVYYSTEVEPYVLQRHTSSKEARCATSVEVVTLDMPWKVRNQILNASIVKTTHVTPHGKTITIETRCEEVPGGIVKHASKEYDDKGKLVRRTTLELISFDGKKKDLSSVKNNRRRRFFRRTQNRRNRN